MPQVLLLSLVACAQLLAQKPDPYNYPIRVPRLERPPEIDGDLSEWKRNAFNDGLWDIARLAQSPWYDPKINRLTDHGNEPAPEDDLAARYYIAWDSEYLYLGAEVKDNRTSPIPPTSRASFTTKTHPFFSARMPQAKKFGVADNAFCFVIDHTNPRYASRRTRQNLHRRANPEERAAVRHPPATTRRFHPGSPHCDDPTLGVSSPDWQPPRIGDVYGLEIVHTDPDGGDYGGHFLIYGRGDDDSTWGRMELVGPIAPIERNPNSHTITGTCGLLSS